jgi:hypothetical protein
MKKVGRQFWGLLAAGLILVFAGFRDWLAPGFLSIAGHRSSRLEIVLTLLSVTI